MDSAPEDTVIRHPLDLNTPEEEDIDANTSALPPSIGVAEALGEERKLFVGVREQVV